ncbi:hypothetical protein C8R44DRAFT_807275 [Mycena epipterygia]|nr:hypothetical protein C8R44DRAFT_807275 [Mycena epipterygia]
MKLTFTLISVALALSVSALAPQRRSGFIDPALVPPFGVMPGVKPTSTGDCDGFGGIKIPCSCPPNRNSFLTSLNANVAAGHATNNPNFATPFPTDLSTTSEITRLQTCIITLQNLFGSGVGCPAESTTYAARLAFLQSGVPTVDPSLVPPFGVTPDVNPTATGDCDGVGGMKIPCSCPPDREFFIEALTVNVRAGHATNNPSFAAPFPTDASKGSQIARLQTLILTLQNLYGVGVGCPAAASTTFAIQLADLQSGTPSVDPALVPVFGITAGVNPTATGDCDGEGGIKIPCSCPPDRGFYIEALSADVAAGHATNNPSFAAPFPTDASKGSQITRLQTCIIALQNLFGPGVGCPVASTTYLQQLQALTG